MGGGYKGSQGRRELGLPRSLVESPRSSQRGSTVCYGAVDETDGLELEAGRDGEDRLPGSLAWSVGFQARVAGTWYWWLIQSHGVRKEGICIESLQSPLGMGPEKRKGGPSRWTATGLEDMKVHEDSLPLVLHYLTGFVCFGFGLVFRFFW